MRIITGSARAAKLKSPLGLGTRPSSDRLREALFSSLAPIIPTSHVLDIFAGTGSLGLEALSRGASSATFVDNSTQSLIIENARLTKLLDKCSIISVDAFQALDSLGAKGISFDIIFADPPYNKGFSERLIERIASSLVLKPTGMMILEQSVDSEVITEFESLMLVREKRYGVARLCFYQFS